MTIRCYALFRTWPQCLIAGMVFLHSEAFAADVAASSSKPRVKLAMFDFELEDLSAGPGESPADTQLLKQISANARTMIVTSGRYSLVDLSKANAPEVKDRWLHQCHGCEASIALKLGAQQSLLGYVTRISRTEYMVRVLVTDAATGTVLSDRHTGLRMGADYSWNRGVTSLIENQVLKGETP